MAEKHIVHEIDRDIVADVTVAEATIQLANGMLELIQETGKACPLKEACTASMICKAFDLTAIVAIGCISEEGQSCPMDNRDQVESDVMDVIDSIG